MILRSPHLQMLDEQSLGFFAAMCQLGGRYLNSSWMRLLKFGSSAIHGWARAIGTFISETFGYCNKQVEVES